MDIFTFIDELKRRNIYYDVVSHREGYIMVIVSIPGERWEVEISKNENVEVEIFKSDGNIFDESALVSLFDKFSD